MTPGPRHPRPRRSSSSAHAPRRQWLLAVAGAAAAAMAGPAAASGTRPLPPELAALLPGGKLQGQARLRFMGLSVYDARLWATQPLTGSDWTGTSLALELEYLRSLKGEQIAERSLAEMRRHGDISPADGERWLAAMKGIFPDVKAGDRITGKLLPGRGARFFLNGSLRGEVAEPEFARLFFAIWLSPRTSEPAMRAALLGSGAAAGAGNTR